MSLAESTPGKGSKFVEGTHPAVMAAHAVGIEQHLPSATPMSTVEKEALLDRLTAQAAELNAIEDSLHI